SPNGYSLIRELQQGMNNFRNTLTAFNKIVANTLNLTIDQRFIAQNIAKQSQLYIVLTYCVVNFIIIKTHL
ncbi:MAG: hypothetical protein Q8850_02895, partial [Candidatus Phytoplasma australasiaticum]|nr:hypothetical protein [Candidatus Phytoplasma australasiaticum]